MESPIKDSASLNSGIYRVQRSTEQVGIAGASLRKIVCILGANRLFLIIKVLLQLAPKLGYGHYIGMY